MKNYPETHQIGTLIIEQSINIGHLKNCDIGIEIAKDGRIWLLLEGKAIIRFKPNKKEENYE